MADRPARRGARRRAAAPTRVGDGPARRGRRSACAQVVREILEMSGYDGARGAPRRRGAQRSSAAPRGPDPPAGDRRGDAAHERPRAGAALDAAAPRHARALHVRLHRRRHRAARRARRRASRSSPSRSRRTPSPPRCATSSMHRPGVPSASPPLWPNPRKKSAPHSPETDRAVPTLQRTLAERLRTRLGVPPRLYRSVSQDLEQPAS